MYIYIYMFYYLLISILIIIIKWHGYNEDNLCDGSEREIDVILLLLSHAGHGSCAATTRQRGLLVSRKVNALKPTFWSQAANIKSAVYLLCSNTLLDQAESVFFMFFPLGQATQLNRQFVSSCSGLRQHLRFKPKGPQICWWIYLDPQCKHCCSLRNRQIYQNVGGKSPISHGTSVPPHAKEMVKGHLARSFWFVTGTMALLSVTSPRLTLVLALPWDVLYVSHWKIHKKIPLLIG